MKQKLLYIIMSLTAVMWCGKVWANETAISGSSFNNIASGNTLTWDGSHVSFKLHGSGMSYYGLYGALQLGWDKSYTLSWIVNTACTINVTKVSLKARTSMTGYITLNGTTSENLYHASNQKTLSTGPISNGNSGTVSIVTSNNTGFLGAKPNFFIYEIKITYTITPDAPSASPASETVTVTIDPDDPQKVNISSYFSSTALNADPHFGSLSYTSSGGIINNGQFYATTAGVYNVYAYLANQENCHQQSANSNPLTITVNRRAGSIVAKDGPFSMIAMNTMNLASCIFSSLGTGSISYEVTSLNNSSAVINGSNFTPLASGTYSIKATKAQDDQYTTAHATFDVTVNKISNTLAVLGDQELKVEETKAAVFGGRNSNAEVNYEITTISYSNSAQNNGTEVISFDPKKNSLTALNAGVAVLRIYQEANAAYEGVEKSLSVNVTKYNQTLYWDNVITDYSIRINHSLATNTAHSDSELPVVYTSSDGSLIHVDETTGVLQANSIEGQSIITASQGGNYKFNAAESISRTFTVYKKTLTMNPASPDTYTGEEYDEVTLSRTLKAGYNTIALPFETNISALTSNANDYIATLSAVTWNSTDGYTLFFTKKTDGVIEANTPYILYLSNNVQNPQWTNITVPALPTNLTPVPALSGGAKDDWKMVPNYTAGKDMSVAGLYGLVNSSTGGSIMKGGVGSTLNAFTAYFTGPSGGNVKARTSFLDFGDEVTALENVRLVDEDEVEGYYATDGRRLAGPQKGIVVVKYRDGRRQKVKF